MSVYQCKCCDFYSTNHSDYNKHITTTKHLTRVNNTMPVSQNVSDSSIVITHGKTKEPKLFLCKRCNKAYKSKNGLMHHTKKCLRTVGTRVETPLGSLSEAHLIQLTQQVDKECSPQRSEEEFENTVLVSETPTNLRFFCTSSLSEDECDVTKTIAAPDESVNNHIVGRIPQSAEEYECGIPLHKITDVESGQRAFAAAQKPSLLPTNLVGDPSLRQAELAKAQLLQASLADRRSPDKFVGVQMNMVTADDDDEDEYFHMGIILDLLPEAQIEMTEHILLIVSIGIISTTFILGLQFFYYV